MALPRLRQAGGPAARGGPRVPRTALRHARDERGPAAAPPDALLAANQGAWLVRDVHDVLSCRAADVIVTGLHQAGGLLRLDAARAICEVFDAPIVRHSLCDLGVATAAALQLISTWPGGSLAHQTHLTLLEHDLLEHRLEFVQGRLEVPTGPGLGVALDGAAVARYEERFRTTGAFGGNERGRPDDEQGAPVEHRSGRRDGTPGA